MIAFRLHERREVASTNDLVKRAIEAGEPEGFVVRADVQTAGYGRQGRAWKSPAGGLYLSVLLRPDVEPRRLPTLSIATAVAVRRALASFVDPAADGRIQVKWPNDIVVPTLSADADADAADADTDTAAAAADGASGRFASGGSVSGRPAAAGSPSLARAAYRKLAGISHEFHAGAMCIGIGANVAAPDTDAGAAPLVAAQAIEGKNAPVYLRDLPGFEGASASAVADAVLRELAFAYDAWLRDGASAVLPEYRERAYLAGRLVRIEAIDGSLLVEGVARDVDEVGRLIVESADGEIRAVSSGEAHLA